MDVRYRTEQGAHRSRTPTHNSNSLDDSDFQYRKLIVWQKAMLFSKVVYALLNQFPVAEKYALADQVRRAVVSVPSNIAEGCGRASNRDYAHFLSIARGSLYETMTQLEMAKEMGYLESIDEAEALAAEISRMLTTLMKKYTPLSSSNS